MTTMMRPRALAKFGRLCAAGALAAVVAGCQPNKQSATRPTTEAAVGEIPAGILPVHSSRVKSAAAATQGGPGSAAVGSVSDPAALNPHLLGLDVYVLSVPAGAVSRNEAFWKRVDETAAVTPDEYDLLFRNGIRVGVADQVDWPYFRGILDERPAASQIRSYVSPGAKSVDLDLQKEAAAENVFYFDRSNRLSGRSYENCSNLWALSFQAVPRDPNLIRVAMTPLIRSQRKRLEVIKHRVREDEPPTREIAYVAPEYLFDLGVESSVPPGKFLVVAPSSEATGGSVGDAFLMSAGLGERAEKVLLLVPRLVPATVEAVGRGK